jgi:hypothetical protein
MAKRTAIRKSAAKATAARAKVRRHRARLRAQGLRPIQLWVPDTRRAGFAAEARRQALAVANSRHEPDDQAFVDSVAAWNGT